MRLLVDSDAFCKLAVSELLSDAVALFGTDIRECGRLPALPYMLRRGILPRTYGAEACTRVIGLAERMPVVGDPVGTWIERLAPVPAIDPGEAILIATASERMLPVITNDVKALRSLKDINGFPEALAGRIVVLEAILLALCRHLGREVVRERIETVRRIDKVIGICFSPDVGAPEDGLRSYLKDRRIELAPLVLWNPGEEGE